MAYSVEERAYRRMRGEQDSPAATEPEMTREELLAALDECGDSELLAYMLGITPDEVDSIRRSLRYPCRLDTAN